MGKAPASQFYWGDLRRDVEYHLMSFEARGVWMEMLTCMWDAKERGKLEGTPEQLSILLGCPNDKLLNAIKEISVTKTGDVTHCNGFVTLINRRMFREERERKLTRCRVQKYRENQKDKNSNTNITLPSSSSSSSSLKDKHILSGKPDPVPFQQIISYLNEKAQKKFSYENKATRRFIRARWNEGKRFFDFQKVVDIKVAKWASDEKMVDFLRPETLFGNKMDSYLNENQGNFAPSDPIDRKLWEIDQARKKHGHPEPS